MGDLNKVKKQKSGTIEIPLKNMAPLAKVKGKKTIAYHGTPKKNILPILKDRLRINGGKAYPANGAVYGRGIYAGNKDVAKKYGDYGSYKPIFKCEINSANKYKNHGP